ncbi:GNAT family N-acetyltransferase [Glacieibacterium frigidum]|uniref:GNAT family N-acetyltransferase n=2 Tax=Glacieibacterium frigidum TaxID=2593303 RepID=A0A552UAN3_9SPHN|nr:GNAT family N-acetyltransferase [Glacieibacterium frigidum]
MHANSPREHVHALPGDALRAPDIMVWTAWDGDELLGIGGLRCGDGMGEVKSMRTHPGHVRRGAGAAILTQVIAEARARGYTRLSLETGTGPRFEAGHALYRRFGFVDGGPFADYQANAFSRFMHLDL